MTERTAPAALAVRLTGRTATAERRLSATLVEVTLDDGRPVLVKRAEGPGTGPGNGTGGARAMSAGAARCDVGGEESGSA
ncbi:hypothetical protein P1P68_26110 [Streptomyces scabiei]|uniref:hypothetical protein n=1 Tax=Streptomyces scabiei TaxID=1930 RepID=UPI00298F4622|nr:hypothetical protein [Streptomyces scabiei]MDW8808166.1 hypothetical protein [Streptomyces scabiei]